MQIDAINFFNSIYNLVRGVNEPQYQPTSSFRDSWLQMFYLKEPHLASVVHSVVSIDKNRGWTLTGSDRLVRTFTRKLHSFDYGYGWRYFVNKAAQAYYTTDMGFVGQVVYDSEDQSLLRVNNLDPARCILYNPFTTEGGYSLQYQGLYMEDSKKLKYSSPIEYLRVTSMPSQIQQFNGLGYCSVSRCVELTKLMLSIYEHDQEQLLAKAPKGLLMLKGISEQQWDKAMENRKENLSAYERDFYGGIQVLASQTEDIEAKLVALSSLPVNFDIEKFTNLLMFGYALAFGYPPEEFWPVQFGSLGRGREVEANEQRSSSKGVGNFILDLQEELQKVLPRTLQFEFKRRDTSGDIAESTLTSLRIKNIQEMFTSGMITREEARQLLAQQNIIPQAWTLEEEDITATDTETRMLQEKYLSNIRIHEAMRLFPNSVISHYDYPTNKITTIYNPENRIKNFRVAKKSDIISKALENMIPEMVASLNVNNQ